MVSYLVMINNCKRILRKKSTYLIIALIPLILILSSSLIERIGKEQIQIGIIGSDQFVKSIEDKFNLSAHISCKKANRKTKNTDRIMGTYNYVIDERMTIEEQEQILQKVKLCNEQQNITSKTHKKEDNVLVDTKEDLSDKSKSKLAMLLMIYMTIAVIYSIKYIIEKQNGLLERVKISGGTNLSYLTGYVLSNCVIMSIQLLIILGALMLCDSTFTVTLPVFVKALVAIVVIANVYSMLIISISKSELMAGVLGSSIAVVLSMIGGAIIPLSSMPKIIQIISMISPIRWLIALL